MKLIVDSVDAENRIRALMQETLLGPKEIDTSIDFDQSIPAVSYTHLTLPTILLV